MQLIKMIKQVLSVLSFEERCPSKPVTENNILSNCKYYKSIYYLRSCDLAVRLIFKGQGPYEIKSVFISSRQEAMLNRYGLNQSL